MKRIHIWQDGPLEADPLFSERLVDETKLLDDDVLWERYESKLNELQDLRQRILSQLRVPTAEETEEYRQRIKEHLEKEDAEIERQLREGDF